MPTFHFTKKMFVISVLCALFIVMAAGWLFTGYLVDRATRMVRSDVADANLIISLNLTNELKRIESAAVAVAGSPLTLPVLQANTPANMEKINNILDRYHKSLDAAACYLIDKNGLTLTSSNRNDTDSFVGQNYTFRPYFQQAIKGGVGQHFAVGTVTKRRGFFASAPVRDKAGQIVGVVTIKKELEDIEAKLNQYIWFLMDPNGIIFLSSQSEARLKSLWPLDNEQQQKIRLSKQYGPGPFEPVLRKRLKAGEEVTFNGGQYLTAQIATPYEGISVVLLWTIEQISINRSFGIVLTLLAILLTLSFLTVIYVFTQSNFKVKRLLEESQSQAAALAESEGQLRDRKDELEGQKELLAQAEERSRLILGSIGEGIFGVDKEGRVTFLNPAASTILGYTEEEMLGELLHDRVHYAYPDGSEFPWLKCSMCLTSQDGKVRTVDNEVFWHKDGTAIPMEYSTTPVWKEGQVVAAVVSFHDITERKRAEGLKVEKEVAEEAAARAEQARQEAERAKEELKAKILEIERFNCLSLGREGRIIELKKQVNALAVKAGERPLYQEHEPAGGMDEELVWAESSVLESRQVEMAPDSLAEILSLDQFRRLLVDFCESAGVAAAIIDLKGEVLAAARWQRACTDFHRVNRQTCARCIESDTELALNLNEGKPFSIYRCKNGLTDAASPIIVESKHIANAFTGQFFTSPPDMEFFRRLAEECGLDAEQYLEAIREVPVVAENKLESVLGFLVGVAQTMSAMAMERNRARQAEITIARRIEEIKSERTAAMSLAEDANQAKAEVEKYRANLELLVRQRTEALHTSEERSRLILGSIGEGIFGLDNEGKVSFLNPAASAILDYTEEEMIGKSMHAKVHYAYPDGSEFPRLQCPMYLSSQDGKPRTVDNEVLWRRDGTSVPVEYTTTPVWKDDQVAGTVVSFRDITERKAMEQKIIAEGVRMRNILDTAPVNIAFSTKDKIHFANPLFLETFGAKVGEASPQLYVHPEERAALIEQMKRDGVAREHEVQMYDRHKRERDMFVTFLPINYEGEDGVLGWLMDITERKAAERALRQAGQEQAAMFESLTLGIAFVKDRIILRGNAKLGELFGRSLDEMVGQTTRIWYKNDEEYLGIGASTYEDLKRKPIHQREQELPRKDGSLFWCFFRVRALDEQDISQGIVCTLEDITERKQAERELKDRMEDLERFSRLTINREEKMIQLKEEINILLEQTDREKKYKIVE
jgi:PAS domain S-box-containing protein